MKHLIILCFITLMLYSFTKEGGAKNEEVSCETHEKWGFFGHRKINRMAVFTLPPPLIAFYKKNIEYITDHAVDPDKRRYATKHEAVRHYIDLDIHGTYPFENIPRDWTGMLAKFTDVYLINKKGDTSQFAYHQQLYHEDLPSNSDKELWKKNNVSLEQAKYQYRQFFIHNILPNYYEDAWEVNCDSLRFYFDEDIDCSAAFALDTFSQHGILPYHLQQMQRRLQRAFEKKDVKKILRLSAEMGHYIGDGHVPLHTTENYNGQLTDQVGIHAFWESRLPELYADETYNFWVGKAAFIDNTKDYYWDVVLTSHNYVDSVLQLEKRLFEKIGESKFCFDQRGEMVVKIECRDYAEEYHQALNGMVEKRMRDAILSIGSAWYTAWVAAGSPDLGEIESIDLVDKELEEKFRKGNIFGRAH